VGTGLAQSALTYDFLGLAASLRSAWSYNSTRIPEDAVSTRVMRTTAHQKVPPNRSVNSTHVGECRATRDASNTQIQ
jgi:hypothetical protein